MLYLLHYQLYCLMEFNWNSNILAIFWYIFIHNFEIIYASSETKLLPESAFYKLFNGIHYVGLTKVNQRSDQLNIAGFPLVCIENSI